MQKQPPKKLFIGLGNPGEEYVNTYHNAGVLGLDYLESGSDDSSAKWEKYKDTFEYRETPNAIFVRPLTFMNESGKAAREAVKKFAAKPESLFVIHDDSDIVIGNYKISFARNSAGHKGVQSVIDALKTKNFTRIRIGIRPASEKKRQKAGEFALKQISKTDLVKLKEVFQKIAKG